MALPEHLILIKIGNLREWEPLSRTDKLDFLWQNLTNEQEAAMRGEFGMYISKLLVTKAQYAIRHQEFPQRYKPLNANYAAYKAATGRKEGFWQNTGFLCDQMKVWRNSHDGSVNIGWPKTLKHPESGTAVVLIASVLEKGTKDRKIPARPLFTPLADRISRSIMQHFIKFIRNSRWAKWYPYIKR